MPFVLMLTYGPRTRPAGSALTAHPVGKVPGQLVSVVPIERKMASAVIRQRLSVADEHGDRRTASQSKRIAPSSRLAGSSVTAVRAASRHMALARPNAYDVDELLARCPSLDTMAAIHRDFNISFDARLDAPWSCQTDGTESSTMLTVYNAFRAMRLIEFDAPIPVLNATNLYEWLFSLNLSNIHFTVGEDFSHASRGSINLRGEVLDAPDFRRWVDPRTSIGLMDVVLLVAHEARHANPAGSPNADADGTIGHPCSNDPSIENVHDPSIAYGGAWAAQYWTSRWFAEHSGHYLTPLEKRYAAGAAEQVRTTRFCNGGVE